MAFSNFVTITADGAAETLETWGEYVVDPLVDTRIVATGFRTGTKIGGQVLIRVPYDPRIIRFRQVPGTSAYYHYWVNLTVGGFTYTIDTMQTLDNYSAIEISAVDGVPAAA